MFFREELIFPRDGISNFRIPNVISTNNGTVLAFCNDRKKSLSDGVSESSIAMCIKRPHAPWEKPRDLIAFPEWACDIGSAVYDDEIGRAFLFGVRKAVVPREFYAYTAEEIAEMEHLKDQKEAEASKQGVVSGPFVCSSDNDGATWREAPLNIIPALHQHTDGKSYSVQARMHGAAHGIRLRHGKYRGRLLCPSRIEVDTYADMDGLRAVAYNNCMYSDDHGASWRAGGYVQVGTGEGTLIELADGSISYNSRAYYRDGKRYLATSTDGGESYHDFQTDPFLQEESKQGCNASYIRVELDELADRQLLPLGAEDLTVFCNPRAETRDNLCACISYDSGKTWAKVKPIFSGHAAYSSLCHDRVSGHFFLLYERGKNSAYDEGIYAAEFDLEWLLA